MDALTLTKLVVGNDPVTRILDACESGLMEQLVPEFLALAQDDAGRGRHKDNLWHTAKVVSKCPHKLTVRLAAFFHDIGKPPTRRFEGGKVTFYQHEAVGARMTRDIMSRLGYDKKLISDVSKIVEMSGRVRGAEDWSDAAVRRFVSEAGDVLDDLLVFCYNDTTSKYERTRRVVQNQVNFLRSRIREVAELDRERAKRPPVNGHQVMERYGLGPGKEIGVLMNAIAKRDDLTRDEVWEILDPIAAAL